MATLIGDYAADHSRFNHAIMPSGLPYQQHESQYRSTSRSRDAPARQRSESSPRRVRQAQNRPDQEPHSRKEWENTAARVQSKSGVSGVPTPPDSSSPSESNSSETRPHDGDNSPAYMATSDPTSEPSSTSTTQTIVPVSTSKPPTHSIPSPASDGGITWTPARTAAPPPAPVEPTAPRQQKTIHITDLAHIQKLAQLDLATGNGPGILDDPPLQDMKFEISAMPIGDIIEMVAALLTKITTTNDLQHDALNRNATHQRQAQAQNEGSESHSSPFSTSVLAFHGKNVPAITILSYLSRIHKYCPTTYEVFLSLLVYFDRMTERVNDLVIKDEARRKEQQGGHAPAAAAAAAADPDTAMADRTSDDEETDEDLADSDDDDDEPRKEKHKSEGEKPATKDAASSSATYFVVDSFNIHRLIIAGVTCASKFFSDVFYTNSRYAKVGGLPLPELNHLELQFLLLNDFRLAVPVEDLEAYATMLVEFYAREVVAQRSRPVAGPSSEI